MPRVTVDRIGTAGPDGKKGPDIPFATPERWVLVSPMTWAWIIRALIASGALTAGGGATAWWMSDDPAPIIQQQVAPAVQQAPVAPVGQPVSVAPVVVPPITPTPVETQPARVQIDVNVSLKKDETASVEKQTTPAILTESERRNEALKERLRRRHGIQ